jgi:hypothetical protein
MDHRPGSRSIRGGPAAAIQVQVREVLRQTEGRGLILAPSYVIPTNSPAEHLRAARDAISACKQA